MSDRYEYAHVKVSKQVLETMQQDYSPLLKAALAPIPWLADEPAPLTRRQRAMLRLRASFRRLAEAWQVLRHGPDECDCW